MTVVICVSVVACLPSREMLGLFSQVQFITSNEVHLTKDDLLAVLFSGVFCHF